ncbi:MAG TPA: GrpB family protein [Pseudonocardiaceae bacterium]
MAAFDAFTQAIPGKLSSAHAYLATTRDHTFTCLDPTLQSRLARLGGPEPGTGVLERVMREINARTDIGGSRWSIPGLLDLLLRGAASVDLDATKAVATVLVPHYGRYVPPELDQRTHRRLFVKGRRRHLHLLQPGSARWRQQLVFRDALRADPALMLAYAQLKTEFAERHRDDREGPTPQASANLSRMSSPDLASQAPCESRQRRAQRRTRARLRADLGSSTSSGTAPQRSSSTGFDYCFARGVSARAVCTPVRHAEQQGERSVGGRGHAVHSRVAVLDRGVVHRSGGQPGLLCGTVRLDL